ELVRFLTSPEIQRVNATARGYAPTRRSLYDDPAVLASSPVFSALRGVMLDGAITRPSTAAGARYDEVSRAYYTAVRRALLGRRSAAAAVAELERALRRLGSRH